MKRLLLAIIIGGYSSYEPLTKLTMLDHSSPWQWSLMTMSSVILEAIVLNAYIKVSFCTDSHYILQTIVISSPLQMESI